METYLPMILAIVLPLTFLSFAAWTFVPYFKQDVAWSRYDDAYNEWVTGGRVGKMPKPEDYGYKTKEESE